MTDKYAKVGRDRFGIMQYRLLKPSVPVSRCSTPAVNKMPTQLERWAKNIRDERKLKELANYERQRPMVSNNTQLYETCLTFLEAAIERKDEERAQYWSKTAFKHCTLPNKQTNK